MSEIDQDLMTRCLELASRGAGEVSPSAMVGALIVSEGRIVGEGFYLYDLKKHAEIHALEMAGDAARGATLYCTLEPCSHFGRTPPCADAVLEAGVSRAVVAVLDPNPQVSGQGVDRLRKSGIEVKVGLCAEESKRLNEIYFKFQTTGSPFVHAVLVESATAPDWRPSADFLKTAFQYDAIIAGERSISERVILDHWFSRPRHRRLTLISSRAGDEEELTELYGDRAAYLDAGDRGAQLAAQLSARGVTSLLALPDSRFDFQLADKITVVSGPSQKRADLGEGFDRREEISAGDFIEATFSKRGDL
jgi:pyrimidine deaminase RibD-like protein